MAPQEAPHDLELLRIFRGDTELVSRRSGGVVQAARLGHRQPDFGAAGFCDPAVRLHFFPRDIDLFGADQGEDVLFAPVLAHQGRGQPKAPPGLQRGRDLEDGRRQQMHFVVNDQSPIALIEQIEMGERVLLARAVGHDLIGGQGHGAHVFCRARILPDRVLGDSGLIEQLVEPLPRCGHAGHQDQR